MQYILYSIYLKLYFLLLNHQGALLKIFFHSFLGKDKLMPKNLKNRLTWKEQQEKSEGFQLCYLIQNPKNSTLHGIWKTEIKYYIINGQFVLKFFTGSYGILLLLLLCWLLNPIFMIMVYIIGNSTLKYEINI